MAELSRKMRWSPCHGRSLQRWMVCVTTTTWLLWCRCGTVASMIQSVSAGTNAAAAPPLQTQQSHGQRISRTTTITHGGDKRMRRKQASATLLWSDRHVVPPKEASVGVILQNRDLLTIGGFVDSEVCWNDLNMSDTNGNGQVSMAKYVGFAKALVPGVLSESITTYDQLPPVYQRAFNSSACLCNNPLAGGDANAINCCSGDAAMIRVPTQPTMNPNATETRYLYSVCSLTYIASSLYLKSAAPSSAPVRAPTSAPVPAPTNAPVPAPTSAPIPAPTKAPVPAPSNAPLPAPTMAPVRAPTNAPVKPPTSAPLPKPTTSPLPKPTTSPLPKPTTSPLPKPTTNAPANATTSAPAKAPSTVAPIAVPVPPTVSPSALPSVRPAAVPPTLPTAPSAAPVKAVEVKAVVPYNIALTNGVDEIKKQTFVTEYLANLVVAMDTVSSQVAANMSNSSNTSKRRQQQRLLRSSRTLVSVTVVLPTTLKSVDNITCPAIPNLSVTTENSTLCQTVNSQILVSLPAASPNETTTLLNTFESNLKQAIDNGDMQKALDSIRWSGGTDPVTVLSSAGATGSGAPASAPVEVQGDQTLSAGAITGISLAAIFFTIPLAFYLLLQRRPFEEDDAKKAEYQEFVANKAEAESELQNRSQADSASLVTDAALGDTGSAIVGATTLGAAQAYYGGKDSEPGMLLDDMDDDDDDDDGATSSNAGSSGWSSSAGISSLNTGSIDDSGDIAAAAGATLAGIGMASAFSRNLKDTSYASTDDGQSDAQSLSRDQLDSLIESGDWAAVGATAALLAAASDSQSNTTLSRTGDSHARSRDSQSVDAARAAELDHLVDAGDWEGVVAAAAKFEAQATGVVSGSGGNGSRSIKTNSSVESSGGSGSLTGTNTAGSPSVTTSMSDSASKAKKREEVRSEVEALVRRVVPEEIDNVDEMMNQFKGREEELVETLRTMQERAVAQKARAAGHRAAKVEARQSVQRVGTTGTAASKASLEAKMAPSAVAGAAAAGAGIAAAAAVIGRKTSPARSAQNEVSADPNTAVVNARSALEQAIEAGDWEAVGEAAAMISDNSVTTTSTGEIERLAGTALSISTTGSSRSRNLSGVNADRASEIDVLIDRGDWTGVITVANRFSESDKMENEGGVRSKEEEDALREAELWMKIADQKKAEGAMDAGASDAAEWAIQRSLSQLKEAEKKREKKSGKGGDDDEDEV